MRVLHHRWVSATFALSVYALGCSAVGGVSFVLKSPVSSACEDIGLKGCPELTDGVILAVEGKKQKGFERIRSGAAENSPEQLVDFAKLLEGLASLPGVAEQGAIVKEVAQQIQMMAEVELPSQKKRQGVAASDANGAPVADHRLTVKMPHRFITADTDRAQLDTGMARPAADPTTRRCGPLAPDPEASCAELLKGPFVITGIHLSRGDCTFSLAAADLMASTPRWRIDEVSVGAEYRLYVGQGEAVFVGATEEQERCAMVWTGFRPYDAAKLDLELRRK